MLKKIRINKRLNILKKMNFFADFRPLCALYIQRAEAIGGSNSLNHKDRESSAPQVLRQLDKQWRQFNKNLYTNLI